MVTIRGESGKAEKGALICDGVMLAVFLWTHIRHGLDMLPLIVPLALIGIYLAMFGVIPETYCFTETALRITHRFRKDFEIPYDAVFNLEASAHDSFIRISYENKVKVYYMVGKKKRLVMCKPCDVDSFVEALKANCPEFHDDEQEESRLEVFFKN